MGPAAVDAQTGALSCPDPAQDETSMSLPPAHEDRVVLDAHESRGLASTILIARELLDHDDLDAEQRQTILRSLARAATTLAHRVVGADATPSGQRSDAA